jgi:mannose-6-phosphate isomerase-like protein (cupin superfamily)
MSPRKLDIAAALAGFDEPWSPRVAGDVNGCQIKLVKLDGEFVWHRHDAEDEAFLVVEGRLRMEFRDGAEELEPGQLIVVPHGVEHRPVALPRCSVLLFEPASTLNTGDVVNERTVRVLERIGGEG